MPVPALPAGMGDTSTMTTETFLQEEQGISQGNIHAMLWLVALQGISCGDMPVILWLVPFPHRQPLQTSSHLTPWFDAPSLCLLWEGPGTKSSNWPAGPQATPGEHRSPFLPVHSCVAGHGQMCVVLQPESHCPADQTCFVQALFCITVTWVTSDP